MIYASEGVKVPHLPDVRTIALKKAAERRGTMLIVRREEALKWRILIRALKVLLKKLKDVLLEC